MKPSVVIGALIVLFGASIILKAVFHIDLPVFGLALGLFFIYLGAKIVGQTWTHASVRNEGTVVGSEAVYVPTDQKAHRKFDVVFGNAVVDLTRLPAGPQDVKVSCVFGKVEVRVDPTRPVQIDADSAFGQAMLPGGAAAAFGSTHYRSPMLAESSGDLVKVRVSVVFGQATVVEAKTASRVSSASDFVEVTP